MAHQPPYPRSFLITAMHLPFIELFIRREERQLKQRFGEEWVRYSQRYADGFERCSLVHGPSVGRNKRSGRPWQDNDWNAEASPPGSSATLFSAFISAVVSGDLSAAEALLADDIGWDLMPTGQQLKGKAEVMPWVRAGAASRKEPVTNCEPRSRRDRHRRCVCDEGSATADAGHSNRFHRGR